MLNSINLLAKILDGGGTSDIIFGESKKGLCMKGRNYITLRGGMPWFVEFMYVDVPEHLIDQCLINEELVGHFRNSEYQHPKWPGYCLCFCRVRKKNIEKMSAVDMPRYRV